jgi:hypothetical protein
MTNGFSDDSTYVYAGTLLGAVCIWPHPGAGKNLMSHAREIVRRELTPAEREKFPVPEPGALNPTEDLSVSVIGRLLSWVPVARDLLERYQLPSRLAEYP